MSLLLEEFYQETDNRILKGLLETYSDENKGPDFSENALDKQLAQKLVELFQEGNDADSQNS
jgi:hypothetical protein